MVDGIGHPPNNNTKQHKNKQIWYNNLHYTHHDFYMYLGMTIVEQPTLLFCRHNKFCYDLVKIYQVNLEMKQTTLQSWSNLPTQSPMMKSPYSACNTV